MSSLSCEPAGAHPSSTQLQIGNEGMEQRSPQRSSTSGREADAHVEQPSKPMPSFRPPIEVHMWLDFALDQERRKHDAVPISPNPVGDWEAIQAWGYITTAYVLAEQALKALVHYTLGFSDELRSLRGTHKLRHLLDALDNDDHVTLNDLYWDYLRAQRAGGATPQDVASFLDHLDTGHGSVGWRYSIQESAVADEVPHFRICTCDSCGSSYAALTVSCTTAPSMSSTFRGRTVRSNAISGTECTKNGVFKSAIPTATGTSKTESNSFGVPMQAGASISSCSKTDIPTSGLATPKRPDLSLN